MSGRELPVLDGWGGPGGSPAGAAGSFAGGGAPFPGLAHQAEPDDPVELVGVPILVGDATFDEMAATFIEEFVREGWSDEHLLAMFRSPRYAGLHVIRQVRGEAWVRDLIAATRLRWHRPDPARAAPRSEEPS